MYQIADVPGKYRQFFFVNQGGPTRKVVSRETIDRQWQLLTLECGDRILQPKYQKSGNLRCGFCGGFEPLPPESMA
jgi:hypothetical protein